MSQVTTSTFNNKAFNCLWFNVNTKSKRKNSRL